jgi:hypothetical protein
MKGMNKSGVPVLNTCPFCGCAAYTFVEEECEGRWHVNCSACDACGPECFTQKIAVEYWNQRRKPTFTRREYPK